MSQAMQADDLSNELRATIRRWLQHHAGAPCSAETWAEWAEMGWLAVGLPEHAGGLGGLAEQAAMAEELGYGLSSQPWLEHVGLSAALLATALPGQDLANELLAQQGAGQVRVAAGLYEHAGRYEACHVQTTATPVPGGWRLQGAKTLVLGAAQCSHVLVLARVAGQLADADGLALFAVTAQASGVSLHAQTSYDQRQVGELRLQAVEVGVAQAVGEVGGAWPAVSQALDAATLLLCADALGAMQRAMELTRDYVAQRRQFGQPIMANQVVRHRLVEMFVATEQARALNTLALRAFEADAKQRQRAVSLAKAFIGPAARRLGQDAVQLHGAIGMSNELPVGQACKRLSAAAQWFGDESWHHERLLQLSPP